MASERKMTAIERCLEFADAHHWDRNEVQAVRQELAALMKCREVCRAASYDLVCAAADEADVAATEAGL